MKRMLSLILALGILLSVFPAGLAEELFEDTFGEEILDTESFDSLSFDEDLPEAAAFEEEAFTEDSFEEESFGELPDDGFTEEAFGEETFSEGAFEEDAFEETASVGEHEEAQFPAEEELPAEESAEVFAEKEQFAEEPVEETVVTEQTQPSEDKQEILIASELEDRSVVSLATDQTEGENSKFADNEKTYWKVAPTVNVIQPKKDGVPVDGQIKIRWVSEWNVDKTELPANVKYYVYQVDSKTGVATQVKTAAAKAISFTQDGRKVSGTGSAVTLDGMKGDEIFYVRAEKITSGREVYGLSSELVYLKDRLPDFELGMWKTPVIRSFGEHVKPRPIAGESPYARLHAQWVDVTKNPGELSFIVKLTYQDKDGNTIGAVKVVKDMVQYFVPSSYGSYTEYSIEQSEEEVEAYTDLGATHVKLTVQPKKDGVKGTVVSRTIQLSSDGTAYKKLNLLDASYAGDSVFLMIEPNRLTHQYLIKGLLTDEKLMVDQQAGTIYPKNPADQTCISQVMFFYQTELGDYEWTLQNANGEYVTQIRKGSPDLLKEPGKAVIGVLARHRDEATATITVQPIKKTSTKAIKGEVHTVKIKLYGHWAEKPVITSLTQTGIREATLCFTQGQHLVQPTAFIIHGFKSKAVVKVKNGELTLPATETGITAVETIKQSDTTYLYKITGEVAAEGESTFTVKPQMSRDGTKESGEESDPAVLNVLNKTKTGVLKLALGAWKDDGSGVTGSVNVTFACIQPKTNVEKFVISLADADSFAGADAYKQKTTLTYKQAMDADGNGYDSVERLYHAVFTGVEKGKTYSVLAETYTVDAGRLVDRVLSVVYGESPKDEKLAEKPDVSGIPEKINAAANGMDARSGAVYIGTQVDFAELLDEGDYILSIDDMISRRVSVPGEALIPVEAGEHRIRLSRVDRQTGETGTWSDPFTLTVYEDLEAVSLKPAFDSVLVGGTISLLPEIKGGSGEYAYKLSVSVNGETASEVQGLEIPAQSKGTYTITAEATDVNLTKDSVPLGASFTETVTVEVGDTFTVGEFTYRLKEEDPTKVMVSAYSGSEAEVIVPATATEEASGRSFAVTEIGEKAFFENTSLTAITLPNAIEVIGVSAFEGCTSLNTMNSVDNP